MKRIFTTLLTLIVVLTASADQYKWGYAYCEDAPKGISGDIGKYLYAGAFMPAEHVAKYVGTKATGVEVYLGGEGGTVNINGTCAFLSAWDEANNAPVCGDVTRNEAQYLAVSELDFWPQPGWYFIPFTEPYAVNEAQPLFIGAGAMSTSPSSSQSGVIGCAEDAIAGGCWCLAGSQWKEYTVTNGYPAFLMRLVFEGEAINGMDAALLNTQFSNGIPGEDFNAMGNVINLSAETVTNITFEVKYDDGSVVSRNLDCELLPGASMSYNLNLPGFATEGEHSLSLAVKSLNGKDDVFATNSTAELSRVVTPYNFDRVVVVEEGTGTWCGWCVRGIVGMEKMREQFPKTFLGIAVHQSDDMAETTYRRVLSAFTGLPNCIFNRDPKLVMDPGYNTLLNAYRTEFAKGSIASVMPEIEYNAETKEVTVKTTTVFNTDLEQTHHVLAYVVLEDNVGPYQQTNNYAGGKSGKMEGWEDQKKSVVWHYADVARGIYPDFFGEEGSIPASAEAYTPYEHTFKLTLPETVWSEKTNSALTPEEQIEKVRIAVLLLDTTNGQIVTAGQRVLNNTPAVPEGVHTVLADTKPDTVSYYDLSGRRVNNGNLQRGNTYIQRGNNASRKIIY